MFLLMMIGVRSVKKMNDNNEYEFDFDDSFFNIYEERITTPVGTWKDHNGNVWAVKDMSDRYIINVINFLKGSDYINKSEYIKYMEDELDERLKIRYGFE